MHTPIDKLPGARPLPEPSGWTSGGAPGYQLLNGETHIGRPPRQRYAVVAANNQRVLYHGDSRLRAFITSLLCRGTTTWDRLAWVDDPHSWIRAGSPD